MTLNSRQEAFCRAYAVGADGMGGTNGAWAAREAGYNAPGAAVQANRLLHNPQVAERIGEFQAEQAARRAEMVQGLVDKLEPVYQAGLDANDAEVVMITVELQAPIAGLISGGSIMPRGGVRMRLGAADHDAGRSNMENFARLEAEAEAANRDAESSAQSS
jgi:phage terminase small subunit